MLLKHLSHNFTLDIATQTNKHRVQTDEMSILYAKRLR